MRQIRPLRVSLEETLSDRQGCGDFQGFSGILSPILRSFSGPPYSHER